MRVKTPEQELAELRREVIILRSFVIGLAGTDPEGAYNPSFVQEILKSSQEKSIGKFQDDKSFLAALQ